MTRIRSDNEADAFDSKDGVLRATEVTEVGDDIAREGAVALLERESGVASDGSGDPADFVGRRVGSR
jgi:hypothetical protein